jgi:hypothetical protein
MFSQTGSLALVLSAIELGAAAEPPRTANSPVPCWEMCEFALNGSALVANPYRDAALVGEFVSPSGRSNLARAITRRYGPPLEARRWRRRQG